MTTGDEVFCNMLRSNRYFVTSARQNLFNSLQVSAQPLSIGQVISLSPGQDQATIYRNVKLFERLGVIKRIGWGNNSRIELSDLFQRHHHHLTCIHCHVILDLHGEVEIELSIAHVASRRGFTPLDHQLEIRGLCKECQKHRTPS